MTTADIARRQLLSWRMEYQRDERRRTGRPIGARDIVLDDRGEYREVVMAASAGECLEAKAVLRAREAHSERTGNN